MGSWGGNGRLVWLASALLTGENGVIVEDAATAEVSVVVVLLQRDHELVLALGHLVAVDDASTGVLLDAQCSREDEESKDEEKQEAHCEWEAVGSSVERDLRGWLENGQLTEA